MYTDARFRVYENYVTGRVCEFRDKVVTTYEENGIDGRFLERVRRGCYDHKIEHLVRCNSNETPAEFARKLICEEIH